MRRFYTLALLFGVVWTLSRCDQKPENHAGVFTKADSLADVYLSLHDTLHQHWNIMINDDNEKIKLMDHLLHELMVTGSGDAELYRSYQERLKQLSRIRFTQKSMANTHVVEEYDIASNALIMDLISAAEAKREYSYNTTLQKLVDNILVADQRMMKFRAEYDSIVDEYNKFIRRYKDDLAEASLTLEPKPLFQVTSIE
jgi:LemA family.